jgi:hypothetical protein
MYATNAAVPRPTPSASNAITPASSSLSGRFSHASHAKPRIDTSWTTPNSHRPRLMPSRTIHSPPSMPPATLAHSPAFLAMRPMSDLVKPMSR